MKVYENCCSTQKSVTNTNSNLLVRVLLKQLDNCSTALELTLPNDKKITLGKGDVGADIKVDNWRAFSRLVFGGMNAWAKSYIDGHWHSSDLTRVIRWGIAEQSNFKTLAKFSKVAVAVDNFYHWRRNNSRQGSRENIAAHYDLGNDFYKQWLDASMSYSSALFDSKQQSLEGAQRNKNNKILQLLAAQQNDKVLEIGCGWGGFAEQAAQFQGLQVSGITLSKEQLLWAQQRAVSKDMGDSLSFSLTDYRDVQQRYDAVVSIEMFEAVGEAHWDEYFATLRKVLKDDAKAVLQVITIDDERFVEYRKKADFIQRYVFPGGMLPSAKVLREKFSEHGFELEQEFFFGEDYAKTLVHWRAEFDRNWPKLESLGFDDRFKRLWHYYLSYCEGGFLSKTIDVGMFAIRKV
ncbi:cyclopropane-fatty-acyl-phospholipid synthase family protein [Gammaproteobacteria bacterium AS21]